MVFKLEAPECWQVNVAVANVLAVSCWVTKLATGCVIANMKRNSSRVRCEDANRCSLECEQHVDGQEEGH